MYSGANLRFITNSITTARLARAVAFFCSMHVFTVCFRRARARRSTPHGTRYWLFVATMLGRGCGTTLQTLNLERLALSCRFTRSRHFVKKALEQGQHGPSHVHKLDLVLLFKRTKRGGRIKSLTLPLASEVVSFKEDFQEATLRKQPRYTEDMVSTACEEAELFDGVPQNQAKTLERMTDDHTQKIVGSGDRRTREVFRRICGVR